MAEEQPKAITYIPKIQLKKRKKNDDWAIQRRVAEIIIYHTKISASFHHSHSKHK
ncbi:hypothetical protein ACHQM5_008369 [Ranunculus cassubicifolius]